MKRNTIEAGETYLGIELGSTRIKAVLIDKEHKPVASGSHTWENKLENGIWTYSLGDFAEIMGIEFVHIGKSTSLPELRDKLDIGDIVF